MPDSQKHCVVCDSTNSLLTYEDGVSVCQMCAVEYDRKRKKEQEKPDARNQNQEEAK